MADIPLNSHKEGHYPWSHAPITDKRKHRVTVRVTALYGLGCLVMSTEISHVSLWLIDGDQIDINIKSVIWDPPLCLNVKTVWIEFVTTYNF